MKNQWIILLSIAFTLIVAIFAVINVDSVTVNYLFGESSWPLILVILGSVLMGGLIVSSVGLIKVFNLQREVKSLKKQLFALKAHDATIGVAATQDEEQASTPKTIKGEQ